MSIWKIWSILRPLRSGAAAISSVSPAFSNLSIRFLCCINFTCRLSTAQFCPGILGNASSAQLHFSEHPHFLRTTACRAEYLATVICGDSHAEQALQRVAYAWPESGVELPDRARYNQQDLSPSKWHQ